MEDDEQLSAGIAAPQPAEHVAHLFNAAVLYKHTIEIIAVNVIEGEEVLHSVGPVIGGARADGTLGRCPRGSAHGTDFQRAPLVETQHGGPLRALTVEPLN